MRTYWASSDLDKHQDQHNGLASENTINNYIGTISADASRFIWMPPHNRCVLKRMYLHNPTTISASTTAYWDIFISQRDNGGNWLDLYKYSTSNRALIAHIPQRYPSSGDELVQLDPQLPVYARFVKTGSPSNLDALSVELIWSLG